jgi:hypothetical protein
VSSWLPIYEIERVCRYMRDDQTVANYFGIARAQVENIRANMRQPAEDFRFKPERRVEQNESRGINSHLLAADDAELGSRLLNEALQRMFRRWEEKHGFQEGAGQILLPAGYVPERDREAA